jgi:hypothetical protein
MTAVSQTESTLIRMWDMWKKGFDAWEASTARWLERGLKSSLLLEPTGMMLTMAMKAKAASDRAISQGWRAMGLATRRDQDRAMHALNQLQSRLIDLEEELQNR